MPQLRSGCVTGGPALFDSPADKIARWPRPPADASSIGSRLPGMAQLIPTSQKFASAGDAKGARRAAKGTSWLPVNAEVVFAARVDSGQKVPQGAAGLFDPVSAGLIAPGSQRRL
jgi:hypothetical protein